MQQFFIASQANLFMTPNPSQSKPMLTLAFTRISLLSDVVSPSLAGLRYTYFGVLRKAPSLNMLT